MGKSGVPQNQGFVTRGSPGLGGFGTTGLSKTRGGFGTLGFSRTMIGVSLVLQGWEPVHIVTMW